MARKQIKGMLGGLGVTFKTMLKPAVTVQYPHEREDPAPRCAWRHRAQGGELHRLHALLALVPRLVHLHRGPQGEARHRGAKVVARARVSILDRFDIDYALCMYCGICVEVCPFDALFWSPEFEYSEPNIASLLHDKVRLGEWMESVPEPEPLELGAEEGQEVMRSSARAEPSDRQSGSREHCVRDRRGRDGDRRDRCRAHAERRARRAVPRRRARGCGRAVHPARRGVRRLGAGARLHRRRHRAVPVRHHAHPRSDASRRKPWTTTCASGRSCRRDSSRSCWAGC